MPKTKNKFLYLFICCLYCGLLNVFTAWEKHTTFENQILFGLGIILVFVMYFKTFGFKTSGFDERDLLYIIFALGFVIRVVYVQSTGHIYRQHDVYGTNGHLEYIERLYNGEGVPNEDVRKLWQYYQPPVWHALCAIWLKIQTFIGVSYKAALENLQLISLYCSSAIMLLSYKLFKMFGIEKAPLVIATGIVAFHPTFIIFSASINNDVLSLTFTLLSVVLAVKWYREPKFKHILPLGLSIGLAMAVKVSSGLIAVGVAILFAVKFFAKGNKNRLSMFGQFASFGVLCVPLALWWQFRNFFKFGVPLTYVPMLSNKSSQYIGFRSVAERLFDFSSLFDYGVYPARVVKSQPMYEYFEYNIPLGALKSAVFGEYYIGKDTGMEIFAEILFWTSTVLAVISVIASIYLVAKAVKNYKTEGIFSVVELSFPLVIGATLVISYTKFCFEFAHFCTMDFRYIALTVVLGALYIGLLLKDMQKNNKMFGSVLVYICTLMTVLMSVSAMAIYGSIA